MTGAYNVSNEFCSDVRKERGSIACRIPCPVKRSSSMAVIETERLVIRNFYADDWADLYEYLSREIVVRYEPYDVFSEEDSRKEAIKRSMNSCYLAVCLKENNKLIGNLYFARQEPEDFLTWEIGYVFSSDY